MDKTKFSRPLSLKNVQITDTFWKKRDGISKDRSNSVSVESFK
ncbi:hypothetical protein [Blautia stercoris]